MSRLDTDREQIGRVRNLARQIAGEVLAETSVYTTTTVERATLRMMGIEGITEGEYPLVNVLIDHLRPVLGRGVAFYVANATLHTNLDPQSLARGVAEDELNLLTFDELPVADVRRKASELCQPQFDRIDRQRERRDELLARSGDPGRPLLYVIVATGNIYEDVRQARSAARCGADIIAVIRSTAQSLLDYVPFGVTTEGFGGTYATQENFAVMRKALDEVGQELGRYIRLVNYASGLCMPEIVVMGALERLDMMLNDSMYGILFRDINMVRTFVDQHFSRMLNSYAGIVINTGEDNYLTTADAIEHGHTVLASNFINEQFAQRAGLPPRLMGLGHAFEINPAIEDSFLLELAQAMLIRECFPEAPLKYMPPTKHMTGNIFEGYMLNTMFNLVGLWSSQGIQLLGMLTEAIHTPHLHDRFLAIENANYVFKAAKGLAREVSFDPAGVIVRRAKEILEQTEDFLGQVAENGLMTAISRGMFADIRRTREGGKGLNGVVPKVRYFNPVEERLLSALDLAGEPV